MIWFSGRGAVSGSSLQIRCEQAQIREVAIASRDASSPRFSGHGGEVGTRVGAAGCGVVGSEGLAWAKRNMAGVALVATRNSEFALTPRSAAAAAKVSNSRCVTCAGQRPLLWRAQEGSERWLWGRAPGWGYN